MDVTSVGIAERLRLEIEAGTKPNADDSSGNNNVRMPGDKEMNQNVGRNNRIGYPRGSYDSEIGGDGEHRCLGLLFLVSRK